MSAIINIDNVYSSLPALPVGRNHPFTPITAPAASGQDRVEFSQMAQDLARVVDASGTRVAWMRSIRSEIVAGTYETPERIAGTVSRLLDVVG